jgi:hypothetical protein
MAKKDECPSSYETYIDIIKPSGVKYVIWFYFQKFEAKGIIECKNCRKVFTFTVDRNELVEHLRVEHYFSDRPGFCNSYENYFEHLTDRVKYNSYNFSEIKQNNLKLSFGVRYAEKFTLLRFPESRKTRTLKSNKTFDKSDWHKTVCNTYIVNPVGSYQGHFDRPMICNVFKGSRPLSFSEYTEFTHSPPNQCNEYEVNHEKYNNLDDLKKIEALEIGPNVEDLNIIGPCSRDHDMSLLYTCIRHQCIFPCVCKDCVLEEKQCQEHQILHSGYFDPDRHAITVRSHDFHDINLGKDDFSFDPNGIIEVIKYAGIEKDKSNCVKCPVDLLHHQAYHFVHHELCKFCRNEKHKYEGVQSKKTSHENMKDKYNEEKLSCHLCCNLFQSKQMKDNHVRTQHGNKSNKGTACNECARLFQSKIALNYHKEVTHQHESEVKHLCAVCQKTFKTKHSVNVHTRTVHNRRGFYCRKCFFNFKLHSHLLRHYKTVHDLDLKKYHHHENADTKPIFYKCTVCDFKTLYKQNLGLHMESTHSIHKLTFQCDQCGYNFTQKRSLTRHNLKVHMQTEEFSCDYCNFTTKFEYNLRRHKDEQHEVVGQGTGIKGRQLYSCKRCNFSTFNENVMYNHNVEIHNMK